jgi:hypothetical protein
MQDFQLVMAGDNRFSVDILYTAECDENRLALLCSSELLAGFYALPDFGLVACNGRLAELNEAISGFVYDALVLAF